MSNSENFQDSGMTSVFYQGVNSERERILNLLSNYFDLTFLPGDGDAVENLDWDNGFLAAIALIRNPANFARTHESKESRNEH